MKHWFQRNVFHLRKKILWFNQREAKSNWFSTKWFRLILFLYNFHLLVREKGRNIFRKGKKKRERGGERERKRYNIYIDVEGCRIFFIVKVEIYSL